MTPSDQTGLESAPNSYAQLECSIRDLANAHHHPPEAFLAEGDTPRTGRVNDVVGQSLGGMTSGKKPTVPAGPKALWQWAGFVQFHRKASDHRSGSGPSGL
jgi:hypothetical protein